MYKNLFILPAIFITIFSLTGCGGGGSGSTNVAPQIAGNTLTTQEDTTLTYAVNASDSDGDTLNYRISQNPENGEAQVSASGQLSYAPNKNYNGTDTLTITVSDGQLTASAIINISVTAVNDAPKFDSNTTTLTLNEDQPLTTKIKATDAENAVLSYSLTSPAKKGTFNIDAQGNVVYTPSDNVHGSDSVTVAVTDGDLEVEAIINITINPINDAPVFNTPDNIEFKPGEAISGRLTATDVDQDTLTYALATNTTLPNNIQFTVQPDGTFTFTSMAPASVANKGISVDVVVSDGTTSTTAIQTFSVLGDPLYAQQWHLNNTGQKAYAINAGTAGHDINLGDLHYVDANMGKDINIAVVDSGLEIAHEDLADNILTGRSYDFLNNDTDPTPNNSTGDHGTSVAGLIAAKGFNGKGGRGVAPDANLMGFNWLKTQNFSEWLEIHGGDKTLDANIVNESYGSSIFAPTSFDTLQNNAEESHYQSLLTNNNNRGVLLIKAAGNSFREIDVQWNVGSYNFDTLFSEYVADNSKPKLSASIAGNEPMSSSFYQTVISALNASADNPLSSYSSVGSSIWVSAPGGEYGNNDPAMITTDLEGCARGYAQSSKSGFNQGGSNSDNENCHYTSTFNGTSSATPVAAGVAALIMQANNQLTWRDVRHILATTAKKIDSNFQPISVQNNGQAFIAEPGWITNSAGRHFHNWYGFGMIDAQAAVTMAKQPNYTLLPTLQQTAFIAPANTSAVTIPENNTGVEKSIVIPDTLIVEAVQVKVSITHGRDADIAIEIKSPSGTRSVVQQPRSLLVADQADNSIDFNNTVLLSNAFYGESSQGTWKIKVIDTNSGDFIFYGFDTNTNRYIRLTQSNNSTTGSLTKAELKIYGH